MRNESGDERFEPLLLRTTPFIGRKLGIQVRVKSRTEERNKTALERERSASRFVHRIGKEFDFSAARAGWLREEPGS